MHELSIAHAMVEIGVEAVREAGGVRAVRLRVRVGALSGVVAEALEFCYDVATLDTPLEGSILEIETVPVTIHCPSCARDVALDGIQQLVCPVCATPSGDVRGGRELEVSQVEVEIDDGGPA
jgi:hydrogenase nickel incorporation protein HypA/HybF